MRGGELKSYSTILFGILAYLYVINTSPAHHQNILLFLRKYYELGFRCNFLKKYYGYIKSKAYLEKCKFYR